jgi:nucleoside 2-deoxyribosyltransferase
MQEVFISHINEEAALATALKNWIEITFPGNCTAFVSSSPNDLNGGDKWLELLKKKLDSAEVVVVLCSPKSLSRRWISWEAGYSWSRGIPLIPICHSGVTTPNLPSPFSIFQGYDLLSDNFLVKFQASLERHLGIAGLRRLPSSEAVVTVNKATRDIPYNDLFISIPMASLTGQIVYAKHRELAISITREVEASFDFQRVYCAAKEIKSPDDMDMEDESAEKDLNALGASKHFLLIYPEKLVSSCLVEAGYALALDIPSTYFVRNPDDLPYMLRKAAEVYRVRLHTYKNNDHLLQVIRKIGKWVNQSR